MAKKTKRTKKTSGGMGLIPEPASIMNYDYEICCGVDNEIELPDEYELPIDKLTKVKNQEMYNACCGFGITSALEADYTNKTGEYVELSPFYTYGQPINRPGLDEVGMYLSAAIKGTKETGVVPKLYFDIEAEMPEIKDEVQKRPDLLELGKQRAIKGYVNMNYAIEEKKIKSIKEAIYKYQIPVVIASDNFFRGGSHCIILYGWTSKNKFKFQNSWGTEYKNDGKYEMAPNYVSECYLLLTDDLDLKFEDVSKNDWFYKDVRHGVFSGLISGTSETTFEPELNMIRGDIATIIGRLIDKTIYSVNTFAATQRQKGLNASDISISPYKENIFEDVSEDDYYYDGIMKCFSNNIMNGSEKTVFKPQLNITRSELAVTAVRCLEKFYNKIRSAFPYKAVNIGSIIANKFSDVNNDSWYATDVYKCSEYCLMNGDDDGKFRPDDYITRAEATAVLVRLFKKFELLLQTIR